MFVICCVDSSVVSVIDVLCFFVLLFFFFKQKTAYEMRISDWSSDVCSSDLRRVVALLFLGFSSGLPLPLVYATLSAWLTEIGVSLTAIGFVSLEIGRASCRERVCQYV